MDWLNRLTGYVGTEAPNPIGEQDRAFVQADLGRLDKLRPDLGKQVVQFVCKGDNDQVLLIVNQLKNEIGQVLHGLGWTSGGKWVTGRSDYFLAPQFWNPAVLHRHGEVLAPIYSVGWPKLSGTDLSPPWFRTLLRLYGEAREVVVSRFSREREFPPQAKEPWTIEQLKACSTMITRLFSTLLSNTTHSGADIVNMIRLRRCRVSPNIFKQIQSDGSASCDV